jgi:Flp pilus assembly protein TadB
MMKWVLFGCLLLAFFLLAWWIRKESIILQVFRSASKTLDERARTRAEDNRNKLLKLQKQGGFIYRLERQLLYSGLIHKFPKLTPEIWLLGLLGISALVYGVCTLLSGSFLIGLGGILIIQIVIAWGLSLMMGRNYRRVNDNLLKFLDFLGSYSVTSGEISGVLHQISKYLDEPLKSVLEECYYEAQTSGDTRLALLSMAEKVEHPRFRELVRNMEISIRYSADFTVFVINSKRAVREHLRSRQERKTMADEAMINMLLLLGMSGVILMTMENLIDANAREILLYTLPGRIGVVLLLVIFGLFFRKMRGIDK